MQICCFSNLCVLILFLTIAPSLMYVRKIFVYKYRTVSAVQGVVTNLATTLRSMFVECFHFHYKRNISQEMFVFYLKLLLFSIQLRYYCMDGNHFKKKVVVTCLQMHAFYLKKNKIIIIRTIPRLVLVDKNFTWNTWTDVLLSSNNTCVWFLMFSFFIFYNSFSFFSFFFNKINIFLCTYVFYVKEKFLPGAS